MTVYLKEGRKNKGKMKCSSCGNEMMRGESILRKMNERYYFCPYCFTYSVVRTNKDSDSVKQLNTSGTYGGDKNEQ